MVKTLILGCGYLGAALGQAMVGRGHEVWGLRRNAAGMETLQAFGIRPVPGDLTRAGWSAGLPRDLDWAVYCAAADSGTAAAYEAVYGLGVRQAIRELRQLGVRRLVYTGSTGVYAAAGDAWVTEESPVDPADEKNRWLLEGEAAWLEANRAGWLDAVVLRIAGIYGAGRGYWLRRFLEGPELMPEERDRWINQVHRDDVVQAVMCALERGAAGRIYNVCDDEPTTAGRLFAWLEARLGPRHREWASGILRARRVSANKRVSNARLKAELGWRPLYPTFREGYAHELEWTSAEPRGLAQG